MIVASFKYCFIVGSPAPADWGTKYGACAGRKQSPIHIKHDAAIPSPLMSNQPWVLTNYDKTPENFQVNLENNGHTGKIHHDSM